MDAFGAARASVVGWLIALGAAATRTAHSWIVSQPSRISAAARRVLHVDLVVIEGAHRRLRDGVFARERLLLDRLQRRAVPRCGDERGTP